MVDAQALSPKQLVTLLDILTHHETYKEIEQFKDPQTIQEYGPPFQDDVKPSAPLLQGLVTRFAVTLPGIKDVAPQFWKVRVQGIIYRLSNAELSEAYDKGNLGVRKTLATAMSSLIEYPARALLGAFKKNDEALKQRQYDTKNPDDVLVAWGNFLQNLVYGDLFDRIYERVGETPDLAEHDSLTQTAHEFIIVNLASFMHYTLIVSPEGQTMVRLMDALHKLAPYVLIRQTLRIGNVATMISGMMRLMLAKVSAGSFTNWVGLTAGADEGMNLLQQIMSTVLGWDKKELKKRLEKIDKDAEGPSQAVKDALKDYLGKSREEHVAIREQSLQSKMSIVQAILSLSSADSELSEHQHTQSLEYLSLLLAVRDRDEIINVLCKGKPDNLTEAVRDAVAAYEPMIRRVHEAVDLSGTVADFQAFMNDMLKLAKTDKTSGSAGTVPSVEEFVHLLHAHQHSCHKFLHQVVKNGGDVPLWFKDYAHAFVKHFRGLDAPDSRDKPIFDQLQAAMASLSKEKQDTIAAEMAAYEDYLSSLHDASAARIRTVITNGTADEQSKTPGGSQTSPVSSMVGPGAFLARWQNLLDATPITPATAFGEPRTGADPSVREASAKDVDGQVPGGPAGGVPEVDKEKLVRRNPAAPGVKVTLEALAPKFREILLARA